MPDLQPFADAFLKLFQAQLWEPGDCEPISALSIDDAYAVQQMVIDARVKQGERLAGYKVGCTSEAIRRQFGLSEPVRGCLMDPHVHRGDTVLPHADYTHCAVEPELAIMMGRDVVDEVGESESLEAAIDFVCAGIEVHNFHFWFGQPTSQELVASNGIHAALVVGEQRTSANGFDWNDKQFHLLVNEAPTVVGTGDQIMGGPMNSLRWLANHLVRRGQPLLAGQWVIPGSPVELVSVAAGDRITVRLDHVGCVQATFRADG